MQIACTVRRQFDDNILPMPEIDIHCQDISERDNPNLAMAFQRSVQAAAELYDRKMIETKEFLRTVYQFGGLVYDENEDQAEGLRRALSNRSKSPSISIQHAKTDPETGDVLEPHES